MPWAGRGDLWGQLWRGPGRARVPLGTSWWPLGNLLGTFWGLLGISWGPLGVSWGPSWGPLWASWAPLAREGGIRSPNLGPRGRPGAPKNDISGWWGNLTVTRQRFIVFMAGGMLARQRDKDLLC